MEDQDLNLWEALDVDDSDLRFLRPCKSRHNRTTKPLLPGPAAAVQAAMSRRICPDRPEHEGDEPISTQEHIRRVLEDGASEEDDDFVANPWLCALDFLRTNGFFGGECGVPGTPLSSIKNGIHIDRVDLVVGIVKSCTQTGLGDLMVVLKDSTGTVDASIHRKVLSKGEYGKNISTGSVLILQKVAVLSPSRSAYYLNITLSNVVKVISKDSGPPLKQINQNLSFRYSLGSETRKMSQMLEATASQEGIMSNLRKNSMLEGSTYRNKAMDRNATPETSYVSSESYKNPVSTAQKESSLAKQLMADGVAENNTSNDLAVSLDEQPNLIKLNHVDNSSCSIRATNVAENVVGVSGDQEIEIPFGSEKQNPWLVSSTSVPEWTDEQLDQLGVIDD